MALRVALLGLGLFQVATGVVAGDLALDQRALLLEGDRLPREAALDRLQQVLFAFREAAPEAGEWPLWSRTCGIQGSWDDAGLERRGEGLLMGMDRALGGQWIGGVLGGVARARLDHDQGHGRTDSRYLGGYAATRVYNQLGFGSGCCTAGMSWNGAITRAVGSCLAKAVTPWTIAISPWSHLPAWR